VFIYSTLNLAFLHALLSFSAFAITTPTLRLSVEMATIISTGLLKQEADDHLRDIRRRKGVDVSNGQQSNNVEDLNRALNM
jgi:hypothetical protein